MWALCDTSRRKEHLGWLQRSITSFNVPPDTDRLMTDGSQQPCGENSDLPSNQVCSSVAELKASAPVQAAQREEPGGMVPA